MILRCKWLATLFAVVILSASMLPAQTPAPPSHPTSTPYTGDLSIFEEPGREKRLQIDRVMDLCTKARGHRCRHRRRGRLVQRPRRAPGRPNGRVIAEDINPKYIAYIQQRAQREHLTNIVPVLGTPDDPKLTPDSLDAALMLKVYHEIAHPSLVLANLRAHSSPEPASASLIRTETVRTTASKNLSSAMRWSAPASTRLPATISQSGRPGLLPHLREAIGALPCTSSSS